VIPVICFVGQHNAGKTTLLTGVIEKLGQKGVKTAVIKHAARGLHLETGSDSGRLYNAGAALVYASSPGVSLLYRRQEQEKSLKEICAEVSSEVDLVVAEGYKRESYPKIEVLRAQISTDTLALEDVIARVADFDLDSSLPVFYFGQEEEIADFIIRKFNLLQH